MSFEQVLGFVIVSYLLGIFCGAMAALSAVLRGVQKAQVAARVKVSDLYPEKKND